MSNPLVSPAVVVFPGQGSQSRGMGQDFFTEFSEAREVFCCASDVLGYNMEQLCFEDPFNRLGLTEFTQPALLTVSIAIWKSLVGRCQIVPTFLAGHSLGEYAALVVSGSLSFSDALRTVQFRGQCMQEAMPLGQGMMCAYIGAYVSEVVELCAHFSDPKGCVEVANYNTPNQLILSGHVSAVQKMMASIQEKKWGKTLVLPVSAPFHSSLMHPAAQRLEGFLNQISWKPNMLTVAANIDGTLYGFGQYDRALLVRQVEGAVRWTQSLRNIQDAYLKSGEHKQLLWIEVGAGTVLQGLIKRTLEGTKVFGTETVQSFNRFLTEYGEKPGGQAKIV